MAAMWLCVTAIVAVACSQPDPTITPLPSPTMVPSLTSESINTLAPTSTITPLPLPAPTLELPPESAAARAALIALYEVTDGANWKTNYIWLSDEPIHKWSGVAVDHRGRIWRLDLSNNELTGEIPSELGNLSNLQDLLLDENQLTGEIPSELGNLSNLQHLILRKNLLSGKIPLELGNLSKLQYLFLDENQLSGEIPSELGNLSKLQHLFLHENQLS